MHPDRRHLVLALRRSLLRRRPLPRHRPPGPARRSLGLRRLRLDREGTRGLRQRPRRPPRPGRGLRSLQPVQVRPGPLHLAAAVRRQLVRVRQRTGSPSRPATGSPSTPPSRLPSPSASRNAPTSPSPSPSPADHGTGPSPRGERRARTSAHSDIRRRTVVHDLPKAITTFLRLRPVGELPGVGAETAATLAGYGLHAVADVPQSTLQRVLGAPAGRAPLITPTAATPPGPGDSQQRAPLRRRGRRRHPARSGS